VHAVAAGRERTHVDVATGPPELRGLAEEFNQMSDALAESAGRQRQLVADASHQLRNPLAALRLRIDTLAAADPAHDPVVRELDRLEALLDGMLALASADSTATDLAASAAEVTCDAATVLADRVEAWQRSADAAGVHLDGVVPAALPVHCAESGLAQVLDVVLDNAIKYAGEHATVHWTCVRTPADTTLTIEDTGPGVPREHLRRLTERFWRASTTTPGSGLGLAIAERLTTAHGGRFTVRHSDRGGLAVDITLRTAP
jgi:signal transduction histidine kinase